MKRGQEYVTVVELKGVTKTLAKGTSVKIVKHVCEDEYLAIESEKYDASKLAIDYTNLWVVTKDDLTVKLSVYGQEYIVISRDEGDMFEVGDRVVAVEDDNDIPFCVYKADFQSGKYYNINTDRWAMYMPDLEAVR